MPDHHQKMTWGPSSFRLNTMISHIQYDDLDSPSSVYPTDIWLSRKTSILLS